MTHRYGAALLHLGLMLLLVACGGGPAPSDVPENVAAQDAAWLEARQAALRGEDPAPATDTTPLPTSPPVTGTPLPPADLTRLAETAISEATVLDEATAPPAP